MPARGDLPAEAFREHTRRLAAERQRQRRARLKASESRDRHVTCHVTEPTLTHAPAPVAAPATKGGGEGKSRGPLLSLSEEEVGRIGRLLEPFASRGYVHVPAFWQDMAGAFPAVPLLVEVYKMAAWLGDTPKKNQTRQCTHKFIIPWLKRAQRDLEAAPRPHEGVPAVPGPPTTRPDPEPPLFPEGHTLERIPQAELYEVLAARAAVPLQDKLAAIRNGHAKGGLP